MQIEFIRNENTLHTIVKCDYEGAHGEAVINISNGKYNKNLEDTAHGGIQYYDLYEYCLPAGEIYELSVEITAPNSTGSASMIITPVFEFVHLIEKEDKVYRNEETGGDAKVLSSVKSILLKYNQEIQSLKSNYIDVVTPTLGGAYPFIRRNGAQKYRSFGLNGLIYLDQGLVDENKEAQIRQYTKDNYAAELILQKLHRDEIINFLQNGRVKLFKSMQEGDMFVYLSNVSLTPDKVSGRALYSFSCTATEVCGLEEGYEKYLGGFKV